MPNPANVYSSEKDMIEAETKKLMDAGYLKLDERCFLSKVSENTGVHLCGTSYAGRVMFPTFGWINRKLKECDNCKKLIPEEVIKLIKFHTFLIRMKHGRMGKDRNDK